MSKISNQERIQYRKKTEIYQTLIETVLAKEKEILGEIDRNPDEGGLKRVDLASSMLDLSSYYLVMNGVSLSVLKTRNGEAQNEARKFVYKSIAYLEQTVSALLDVPYAEYEEKLERIAALDVRQRYFLIRKMGLAVKLLESAYGENSKWKWAFVELEGRHATVAKNMIDLRNAVSNTDPRSPNYAPTVYLLRLVEKLLMRAADRYRERYELSTNHLSDFQTSIDFLSAFHRLCQIMGNREKAWDVKRKLGIWEAKLKSDALRSRSPEAPAADLLS